MRVVFRAEQIVAASIILLAAAFSSVGLADDSSETMCLVEDECVLSEGETEFDTEGFGIRIPSVREIGGSVSDRLKDARDGVASALHEAGIPTDFRINNDDKCALGVATTVGGSMACGGCIAASAETAGATAVACSNICGTASGALVVALHSCKI